MALKMSAFRGDNRKKKVTNFRTGPADNTAALYAHQEANLQGPI